MRQKRRDAAAKASGTPLAASPKASVKSKRRRGSVGKTHADDFGALGATERAEGLEELAAVGGTEVAVGEREVRCGCAEPAERFDA
mmetsp:Transcript_32106/g.88739  ORF Transcript_32106/g.88739 Transcript_32106/m.88739 type:complete len:86 (+) Transcript_32106:1378-1635(+)